MTWLFLPRGHGTVRHAILRSSTQVPLCRLQLPSAAAWLCVHLRNCCCSCCSASRYTSRSQHSFPWDKRRRRILRISAVFSVGQAAAAYTSRWGVGRGGAGRGVAAIAPPTGAKVVSWTPVLLI